MSGPTEGRPFGPIERISLWSSAFCMTGMVLLILAEILLRGVFNSTTEHSDELVGYMLVGVVAQKQADVMNYEYRESISIGAGVD